jgi:short-subunit dehydrogenase
MFTFLSEAFGLLTLSILLALELHVKQSRNLWSLLRFNGNWDGIYLTVLVNNAGGGPVDPVCQPIWESAELQTIENVSLNALFPLQLTRVLLPILLRNSPSLIINVSTVVD